MIDVSKQIEGLVSKAAKVEKSEDAMRFSQAACNSANAMAVLDNIQRNKK